MKTFLTKVKAGITSWVAKLEPKESMKMLIGLATAALYLLSSFMPALGQWLLCGVLILISFISFSSLLLSVAGVSIKKLEPVEDMFNKAYDMWEGDPSDQRKE